MLAAVLEGLILAESHLGSFRLRCPESVAAEDVAGIEGEFAVHAEDFEGAGNGVDVHDAHGAGFALQDLAHLRIARLYGTSGRPAPSCGLPGRTKKMNRKWLIPAAAAIAGLFAGMALTGRPMTQLSASYVQTQFFGTGMSINSAS